MARRGRLAAAHDCKGQGVNQPVSASQLQAAVSGSSFYAGMRVLPKVERAAMFAIY